MKMPVLFMTMLRPVSFTVNCAQPCRAKCFFSIVNGRLGGSFVPLSSLERSKDVGSCRSFCPRRSNGRRDDRGLKIREATVRCRDNFQAREEGSSCCDGVANGSQSRDTLPGAGYGDRTGCGWQQGPMEGTPGRTRRMWTSTPLQMGRKSAKIATGQTAHGSPGEEPLAEGHGDLDWDGLERWKRGGGVVHRLAQVDASVVVESGAIVHANAVIGADTRISSGSVVGPHVTIGSQSMIGYNVALQNCSMGNSCILHSGVCIGQDGFGFNVGNSGEIVKKPQMLNVRIGNNVEIGANSCIDRGSWRDTTIGDHTKIDNLVQVGHNVVIGRCCMLCGQVGLAGSSSLGDYVVMGGKSGVADHVSVTSKVRIAAKSGVTTDIVEPGDYGGFPAAPAKEWRRSVATMRRLGKEPQLVRRTCTEGILGGELST